MIVGNQVKTKGFSVFDASLQIAPETFGALSVGFAVRVAYWRLPFESFQIFLSNDAVGGASWGEFVHEPLHIFKLVIA